MGELPVARGGDDVYYEIFCKIFAVF